MEIILSQRIQFWKWVFLMHGHKLKMVFPMKDLTKEEDSGLGKKTQSRNSNFLYSEVRLLDKEVTKKYKILIQDVENYILKKNGRRKATRKHWTPEDREKWKLRYPECPLCLESYDESNPITKEHITPLFLGGLERDCNVIAICHKCNKSRDYVMKKVLATTDIAQIRERWPAIKPAVDNFVIWCHITLYDFDNLHQVKDLNHAFKNERNIDLLSLIHI